MKSRGALFGLLAATLFGLSAPLAKMLLPGFGTVALAALLYLGGGIGLTLYRLGARTTAEAPLRKADVPWLVALVLLGGIAGPVLMLWGLQRLTAMTASLMLNLEGPLTVLLSVMIFREHLGRRGLLASALIFSGAAFLSVESGRLGGDALGALAVAGACLCWAIDNNLTQRLTVKDPVRVVQVKTLGAGAAMFIVSLSTGERFGETRTIAAALVLGALSYGASILLDAYALRLVGAAREAAYFATAPFIGAAASIPLLGERPAPVHALSGVVMVAGVVLLLREKHSHVHTHEPLVHEHRHEHDEHHQHEHAPGVSSEGPHSHVHTHAPLTHEHPHVPDAHHRHRHH